MDPRVRAEKDQKILDELTKRYPNDSFDTRFIKEIERLSEENEKYRAGMQENCGLRKEIERLRAYVGSEEYRSDFQTAGDMRAELERLRVDLTVLDGTACAEEVEAGSGPCGVCKTCLRTEIERLRRVAVEAEHVIEAWEGDQPSMADCITFLRQALAAKER